MHAIFAPYFPADKWEPDTVGVAAQTTMFRLKGSELRMIMVVGLEPATKNIAGLIFMFRAGDDSMNMEMDLPAGSPSSVFHALIKTAVEISGHAPITHGKFLACFHNWLKGKSTIDLTKDEDEFPISYPPKSTTSTSTTTTTTTSSTSTVPTSDAKKRPRETEETESDNETCCVCLDKPADTIAAPCGHKVVCGTCSDDLRRNRDRVSSLCVLCQQPITHVVYPDDSIKQPLPPPPSSP